MWFLISSGRGPMVGDCVGPVGLIGVFRRISVWSRTHRGVGFFVGRGVVGLFVGDRVYLQLVSEKHDSPSLIRSKKRCIRNT
eukprot:scaffold389_cov211-Alexandrium_tamarense.AAC.7